jgi:hypothetical protein
MGLAVSLIITAVGLILALAVHPTNPGSFDVNTAGWILFVVGLIGFVVDLLLWSSWGPGYLRRSYTAADAHPTRPAYRRPARRTVVDEEEVAGSPPGPPGY